MPSLGRVRDRQGIERMLSVCPLMPPRFIGTHVCGVTCLSWLLWMT
ncbi:hypothetical protein [Parathermosynechococcus lividus]